MIKNKTWLDTHQWGVRAFALERAAHADLQRRFEKVMDRIHVFGERI